MCNGSTGFVNFDFKSDTALGNLFHVMNMTYTGVRRKPCLNPMPQYLCKPPPCPTCENNEITVQELITVDYLDQCCEFYDGKDAKKYPNKYHNESCGHILTNNPQAVDNSTVKNRHKNISQHDQNITDNG